MTGHPPAEELARFLVGKVDEGRAEAIAIHLEACTECLQQLEALPDDDPLVRELRACSPANPRERPDLRGRRIAHYELLEELGRGGTGVVYRAYDPHLKRDVALKLILGGEHADAELRQRLRQEAEAIANLRHPGILQVFDVGEADDFTYLALELLHPGGLNELTGGRQHSARWYARLMKQIAEALGYAHAAGIVHRDLKPENLLLAPGRDPGRYWPHLGGSDSEPPMIKITDFGLCKAIDEDSRLTRVGTMLGTPDYMAPEQTPDSGVPVGAQADVFALGAILYELLTGTPPFHSDTISRQLKRLRDDPPKPPRKQHPGLPRELEAICLKCLEKNPANRYASARELEEDLDRFLAGEPVLARPVSLARRTLLWARRKPLLTAHLCTALLLYLLHLFAMQVLLDPSHMSPVHERLTLLVLGWAAAAVLIEILREHPAQRRLGETLFALLPPLLIQMEHWVAKESNEVIVLLFVLFIPTATLIRPQAGMIITATATTLLSFNLFVAIRYLGNIAFIDTEQILFTNLILLMLGLVQYLTVRRLMTAD
jgi:serine/threonine protein kinase